MTTMAKTPRLPTGALPEGKVRIAEVTTPSVELVADDPRLKLFEGYRRKVRFIAGRAVLPEPVEADFSSKAAWEAEHKSWADILDAMQRDYGYEVTYRVVSVEDER